MDIRRRRAGKPWRAYRDKPLAPDGSICNITVSHTSISLQANMCVTAILAISPENSTLGEHNNAKKSCRIASTYVVGRPSDTYGASTTPGWALV